MSTSTSCRGISEIGHRARNARLPFSNRLASNDLRNMSPPAHLTAARCQASVAHFLNLQNPDDFGAATDPNLQSAWLSSHAVRDPDAHERCYVDPAFLFSVFLEGIYAMVAGIAEALSVGSAFANFLTTALFPMLQGTASGGPH